MDCSSCGTRNPDDARYCLRCGKPVAGGVAAVPRAAPPVPYGRVQATVPNYLPHSILATVFCCLIFGLIGVIYAAQVNGKLQAGDLLGARHASRMARNWTLASVFTGLSLLCVYLLMGLIAGTLEP